ncbi:MAG: hypothetical protein PWR01_4042 [Clostridiales bacterium]|nr:hypothetical protein [Clostridiales bacterium]MDN5282969.1 hypothetical protein [Candidatus Ozemobacter sp.]
MHEAQNLKLEEKEKIQFFPLVLLAAIICLIPAIVYLGFVKLPQAMSEFLSKDHIVDFFAYSRSLWLHFLAALSLLWLVFKKAGATSWYQWILIVYAGFLTVSTFLSTYPEWSLWGDAYRYEGFLTHLSYIVTAYLAISIVKSRKAAKFVLGLFFASATFLCLVGILQFFGFDYFYGEFANRWLVPDSFRKLMPEFSTLMLKNAPRTIFSTFGNENFTGSYMAMLFPLSFALMIGVKDRTRYFFYALNALAFFNLMGCKSRAGQLGAIVSTFCVAFMLRHRLKDNLKQIVVLLFAFLLMVFVMDAYFLRIGRGRFLDSLAFMRSVNAVNKSLSRFESIELGRNFARVIFDDASIKAVANDQGFAFYDSNEENVPFHFADEEFMPSVFPGSLSEGQSASLTRALQNIPGAKSPEEEKDLFTYRGQHSVVVFPEDRLRGFEVFVWPKLKMLQIGRTGTIIMLAQTRDGFRVLGYSGNFFDTKPIEKAFPESFDRFANARGYMWSRTLPLLKNAFFWGYGPDTFAVFFPQHDVIGKLKIWRTALMIVEKPHSMYFQIAVNSGVLSLVTVLILFLGYLWKSLKLYYRTISESFCKISGIGLMAAVLGYLIAAFFNDSVISVAPAFWGLLGIGIAVNSINEAYDLKSLSDAN